MNRVTSKFCAFVTTAMMVAVVAMGCADSRQQTTQPQQQAARDTSQPRVAADANTVYWPTGDRATSVASIQQTMPSQVSVNQQFPYTIRVTNITNDLLLNDTVVTNTGENLTVSDSQPSVQGEAGAQQWNLGTLQPGQSKTVQITASASEPGDLLRCTSLEFTPAACVTARVVQPALQLTAEAPDLRLVCEEIPLSVTVTNTGTGPAQNVAITSTLPEGATTRRDNRNVDIQVGTLAQGESRTFTIPVRTTQTGQVAASFNATGAGELSADAQTSTNVTAPVLTVEAQAPQSGFIDRTITHEYVVSNTGDAVARDAQLIVDVAGVAGGGQRTYNLGTIEPNASRTVQVETQANSLGEIRTSARATAFCAEAQTAQAASEIRGTSGVLMEVIDQNDPVRVGGEEVYTILVTNQGTADQTNVDIRVDLGPNMSFISAGGATEATAEGNVIDFASLGTLGGRQAAKWTVRVRAEQAADARFTVQMATDQIGEPPVMETEATTFYE